MLQHFSNSHLEPAENHQQKTNMLEWKGPNGQRYSNPFKEAIEREYEEQCTGYDPEMID